MLKWLSTCLEDQAARRRLFWILALLALFSLYLTLNLPYLGEEGQYTFPTLEMWYRHTYWAPITLGGAFQRPPMFNWLTLPIAHLLGGQHILIAARLVTASATLGTACLLGWFVRQCFEDNSFAPFVMLCYLSGDLLFRRGWITYADPTFALFTFASMMCLWIGSRKQNLLWLLPAILCLTAAFLTKALTAYVFYGITGLVLMRHPHNRRFLLQPASWLLHAIALCLPFVWFALTPHLGQTNMWVDLLRPLKSISWHYPLKLIEQPLTHLLRLAPISFLGIYYAWQTRHLKHHSVFYRDVLWVVLLNYAVYWITPKWADMRYLLPILPFVAILIAYPIFQAKEKAIFVATLVILFFLIVKYVSSEWGLPWFERMSRAYPAIARDILNRTQGQPLYTNDTFSSGLSIIGEIDAIRWPNAPLTYPPDGRWPSGFVIRSRPNASNEKVVQVYHPTSRDSIYLLCRGSACGG